MSHTTYIKVEIAAVMYSEAGNWNRKLLLKSITVGIEAIIEIRVKKMITEKIIKEVAENPKYLIPAASDDWSGFEKDLETIKMNGGKIHKILRTYITFQAITDE